MNEMPEKVIDILTNAKWEPKRNYRVYSCYIRQLDHIPMNPDQRDSVQREIVRILEV
jgi:hypothetical protein